MTEKANAHSLRRSHPDRRRYVRFLYPTNPKQPCRQPGSPLQPLVAAINCTLWVAYGFLKEKRDYPVMLANAPGIILGLITFVTSF